MTTLLAKNFTYPAGQAKPDANGTQPITGSKANVGYVKPGFYHVGQQPGGVLSINIAVCLDTALAYFLNGSPIAVQIIKGTGNWNWQTKSSDSPIPTGDLTIQVCGTINSTCNLGDVMVGA